MPSTGHARSLQHRNAAISAKTLVCSKTPVLFSEYEALYKLVAPVYRSHIFGEMYFTKSEAKGKHLLIIIRNLIEQAEWVCGLLTTT